MHRQFFLLEKEEQIARNLVEKLFIYGSGRLLKPSDRGEVSRIFHQMRHEKPADSAVRAVLFCHGANLPSPVQGTIGILLDATTFSYQPLMNRPKVLIIVGDATETVDTLYPFYRLIEGGFQPVVAAPEKRRYQMVLHEVRPGWTITKEWEGYSIEADIAFKDINPADYAGIFFSGGRAPEYIREDEDLLRITRWFWEQKRPMASVCHGVEIPARAGIVNGLRMATVAKCRFDLEICGGIYVNEPCVIDRHMVSGRTYHDCGHFVGPWIKMLEVTCGKAP